MRTILVTGGAGFVGSSLALRLRSSRPDLRIVALDNLKRRGSELNLPRLRQAGVDFVHGDIRNPEDLRVPGSVDLILECSAEPSVLAGYGDSPAYVVNTNLMGTSNCLELARRHEAGIIFFSTSRVYPMSAINSLAFKEAATRFVLDDAQGVPGVSTAGLSEAFPLDGVRSLYGATKLCSELLLQEYLDMYGLHGAINRCGVITGPWQMGKVDQGVVVLWVARHVFGGALSYIGYGGQGKQVRDMLHIDDLFRLVLYEIEHLDTLSGSIFNVGGGHAVSVSLQELTAVCREVTGEALDIGSVPAERPGDVRWYITDHARVTQETDWRPEKDVRAIVTDIRDWLVANETALRPILGVS